MCYGETGEEALLPKIFANNYITRETFASIAYPGSNPPGSRTVPPFFPTGGNWGGALVRKIMANLIITIVLLASIALPGSNCLGTRNAPSFYQIGVQ